MSDVVTPVPNHACDACGQLDDHPMVHVGPGVLWQKDERTTVQDPSFHFDCLPTVYAELLGDEAQHAVTLATIAAAKSGVHGDELRAYNASLPTDNDLEGDARFEPITPTEA